MRYTIWFGDCSSGPVFCAGSDAETRLEDGCHHPRAEEGDQDHEHGAVHAHDGLAAGADWTYRADAGGGGFVKTQICTRQMERFIDPLDLSHITDW